MCYRVSLPLDWLLIDENGLSLEYIRKWLIKMSLLSATKQWFGFRGRTLTDELYLIKSFMFLFFLGLANKGSLAVFEKRYLFKKEFHVVSFGATFVCRRNSTDLLYVLPFYERALLGYFKITPGVFVDVGAHTGRYSLIIAKNSIDSRVYSFEPTPETYTTLIRNISSNNLKNIFPQNIALSNQKGKMNLFLSNGNEGENTLVESDEKEGSFTLVQTNTLDNVIMDNNVDPRSVKLIKMDVEGAEYFVFQGSEQLLNYGSPSIIFESNSADNLLKCKALLNKYGYIVKKINSTNYIAQKLPVSG
jgi:FkbM family methyltransferase